MRLQVQRRRDLPPGVQRRHQLADAEDQHVLVVDRRQPLHRGRHLDRRRPVRVAQDPPVRPGRQREQRMLHRRHVVLRDRPGQVADEEARRCLREGREGLAPRGGHALPHETVVPFSIVVSVTPEPRQAPCRCPRQFRGSGIASPWFRNRPIVVPESPLASKSPDPPCARSTWRSAAGAVTQSLTPNNTGGFFPARSAPAASPRKSPRKATRMLVSVPYAANRATLPKTRHMRPEQMSRDPDAALPPYFSISPDAALAELGGPVGTGDFAAIAEACARGRADLAARGLGQGEAKRLRLFSTWEITRYLIPVAPPHFRRVLRANPELPQGRTETRRAAPAGSPSTRCCGCARTSPPKARAPRNTGPGGRRACRPRSRRSPTSRAASARPRRRRIWRCRRRSTATGCWSSTSTARAR